MSAFFSWQQVILKSEMEPTTRLVCLTIGCHMAMDGTGCFPSYALIAEESGLSRRTVIDHVQAAVVQGYLKLEHRERENGSSTSNLYQPVMPQVVQELHRGSEPAALGVVQELHPHNNPSLTAQRNSPSVSPQSTKATKHANTGRSIALTLEDLTEIPDDLRRRTDIIANIDDEWAKFRNHHISVRSKHTRLDLAWDTWCRNAAKWQRGSAPSGTGAAGPRGQKQHDIVASATDTALRDLFGIDRNARTGTDTGSTGAGTPRDARVIGSGATAAQTMPVDAGSGFETVLITAGGSARSGEGGDA